MARDAQIQMRRDTAANWTSTNPTLAAGEVGFETDTYSIKIGDGSSTWNNLIYTSAPFVASYGSSGNYWFPSSGASVAAATLNNTMSLAAMYLPKPVSISRVACNVTTAAASSVVRIGLYQHDPTTGRPKLSTSPLFDWGTIDSTTTGVKEITGLSATLPGGWSWLAWCAQGGGPSVSTITNMNNALGVANLNTTSTPSGLDFTAARGSFTVSSVTGAFGTISTLSNNNPSILKVAFKTT